MLDLELEPELVKLELELEPQLVQGQQVQVQGQGQQVQGQQVLEPGEQVPLEQVPQVLVLVPALAVQVQGPELVLEPRRVQASLVELHQEPLDQEPQPAEELLVLVQLLELGQAPAQLRVRGQSLAQVQGVQEGKVQEQLQVLVQQVLEPEVGDNNRNHPHSRVPLAGRGMDRNHRAEDAGKELPCMDRGPDKELESVAWLYMA